MKKSKKAMSAVFYILPALFLICAYFLMTVTTEDMVQGAGEKTGYLSGMYHAFKFNSRLGDMYAWPAIKCFDYQFRFGVDTFIRLFDVALGLGIIYVMTTAVLGERPRLRLRDGALFCALALAVFLNPWCGSLFCAFSHIHNYLLICFFSVLFFLPFALKIKGRGLPKTPVMRAVMLPCGFLFGFSSNTTPAAFMLVLVLVGLYLLFTKRITLRGVLSSWELWAAAGVLAACVLMYGFGSGVSSYTGGSYADITDYVSVPDMLRHPGKPAEHLLHNLYYSLPCLLPLTAVAALDIGTYKNRRDARSLGEFRLSVLCLLFVTAHCLALTPIRMETVIRLFMPACVVTTARVGSAAARLVSRAGFGRAARTAGLALLAAVTVTAVYDMAYSRLSYSLALRPVLEIARSSDGECVYISRSLLQTKKSDIFGFYHDPMITDWSADKPVYGKKVVLTD